MKRISCALAMALLICSLEKVSLGAQATAQINGVVKDQTGAVLPGVDVSATQTDTGLTRTAVTDETGAYILQNLPLGPYRVEAGLPGFRTYIQTGIVLQVNSNPAVNPILEIGQVSEQVEVQANAALVETRNSGVGQVIENERILELPLNGRQVTDLITLSGAAVTGTTGVASQQMQGTVGISVAGGTTVGVAYALDGVLHNTPWSASNLPFPFPDALQEFKVETGGLSAQNGMRSGASVNSVTRSGTNEFHGNLFEFVRNNKFNARNYFAAADDGLKRNQFGGTIGGPVMANKLFFFAGYQGTVTHQRPSEEQGFVPTAQMLAGDFTTISSAACRSTGAITLLAPFTDNKINPSEFSKAALALTAQLPKTNDPCGKVLFGYPTRSKESQAVGRMDFQLSSNNSIFGRYMATTYATPPPYELLDNLLTTQRSGFDNLSQAFAVGNTYLVGSNTVNSVRMALNRNALQRTHKNYFSGADLGVKMYDGYMPDYMILTVTGGPNLGGGTQNNATFRTTTYQIAEDLSLIRGQHQLAFGANVAHWRNNVNANVASAGSFNFNGTATRLGMADFLTGKLTTMTQAAPNVLHDQQWYFGFYGQDTWRLNPRLTVNYGLRWEPWFPAQIVDGRIYHFDEAAFLAGTKSTVFKNAPAGFSYPGDPGFPEQSGMNLRATNFGPRIGLAWDVQGDGRTSVRTSYSRAFDFVPGQFHINTVIANPWGARIVSNSPAGGFDDPWLGIAGGNPFPVTFDANAFFALNGTYNNFNYDNKTTTVDSWSLALQRQIGDSWLASSSYIGNHTIHLWTSRELNAAVYYPGSGCTLPSGLAVSGTCSTTANINDRRKYVNARPDGKYIGSIGLFEDGGTSRYNGLLLSLQRRASRGVSVSANYTWSHCYGDVTQVTGTPNGGTYQGDRREEAGNCDNDRRHLFNSTAVVDTPQFANPALRAIATGWKISGIFKKMSGSYMTITSGTDIALTGIGSQRPNQVLEDPYGDKTTANFLNPKAFVPALTGQTGNMRRMNVAGPGFWTVDMALSRAFRFKESQRVEIRAEAFNVTNSLRMNNPSSAWNSATFGQVTSAQDPRIMQFALKYVF